MKIQNKTRVARAISVMIAWVMLGLPGVLLAGPPTLDPNPGKHVLFPAKGQTPEQQNVDETAAYEWATEQTSWDPYQEYNKLVEKGYVAAETADAARGGGVRGAAGGALLGVAIGAIAGDAGKGAAIGATAGGIGGGARTRRTQKAATADADGAVATFQKQFALWDRNFVAAMEGKGYTVK